MPLRFSLLGPIAADRDGEALVLGTVRQRALLALLALDAGRVVPIDTIVDALWAEDVPARAEVSVRSYVSNLRRVLEPDRARRAAPSVLRTSGTGYSIASEAATVDALDFGAATRRAARAEHDADWGGALAAADEGLRTWHGPALADVQGVPFAPAAAVRLEADRDRLALLRLRSLIELRRHAEAVAGLETRVAGDPLDEAAIALLMRALYALGRPTDALAHYGALVEHLAERGLVPSPALRALEGAVLSHDLALDASPEPASTPPEPPPDLVGRADAWAVAVGSSAVRPRFVVLGGEAGIGKTFLAEAVAARFGGRVVWGAARRDDDQPPLWLWDRALVGLGDAGRLGDLEGDPAGLAGVATAIGDRLGRAAREQPLLVVLDDLQWADSASLTVLAQVAAELRDADLTVLITVRPSPEPAAVDGALAEVLRRSGARRVDLAAFDVDATRTLATSLGTPVDDTEAARLQATASGNPLLLRELLRLPAGERGSTLPASIATLAASRLDPLPDDTAELLALASLAGDDIDLELLAAVLGREPQDVVVGLQPAVRASLVVDGPLRFRHATLREVVAAALDPSTRRQDHARIAAAMATDADRWPPARAVHHLAVGRPLTPVDALVDAARTAAAAAGAIGAFAEQARLLEVALADDAVAGDTRLALTIDAAEARVRAGDDVDGRSHVVAALELADRSGDAHAAGRAAQVLARGGGAWFWVPYGEHPTTVLAALDRAAGAAEAAGDRPARATLLAALAVGESYGPDPAAPGRLAALALEVGRAQPDPAALAEALVAASWAAFGARPPSECLALAAELDALAEHLPPERLALIEAFRMVAALRAGAVDDAARALSTGESLARANRLPAFDATFGWARAGLVAATGRLGAAAQAAETAHQVHQRTQVYAAELARWVFAIHLADQRGEIAAAEADVTALAAWDDHADLYQAQIDVAAGRAVDPTALTHRLAEVLAEPPVKQRIVRLAVVGRLVADAGLDDLAADAEHELAPHADEVVVIGTALSCAGPVGLVLGRLARSTGRLDEASHRFEVAVERCSASGLDGWLAPAALGLAETRHAAGDRTGAAAAAEVAMGAARQSGQPGLVDAAARLRLPLRSVGGRSSGQARRPRTANAEP